ncbi:acetate/propionate family kinase [candidate division KSB1 bacterium]|nr:acetate/propionate family kinase [candidate division KSB1 bacterium]
MPKILVLIPTHNMLVYAVYSTENKKEIEKNVIKNFRYDQKDQTQINLNQTNAYYKLNLLSLLYDIDMIGIRGLYGGTNFKSPVQVNNTVLKKLESMIPESPLNVPVILELIRQVQKIFKDTSIILFFETAFFVNLPVQEQLYALNAEITQNMKIRRYGYHGLFHENACRITASNRNITEQTGDSKILSICLDPIPELATICGHQPLTVTSGITPLDGLPGNTTCGELDSGIIITLEEKMGWGPEEINNILTHQSGLTGLACRKITVAEVLNTCEPGLIPVREYLFYRILLTCGAGLAVLHELDAIVISGRYARSAEPLVQWLKTKLSFVKLRNGKNIIFDYIFTPLELIIAQKMITMYNEKQDNLKSKIITIN